MGYLDSNGLGVLWKNIVGKSIPYGYCTTGASTRAKTVTVSPAITELTAGVQILVKFQYANTASTTSSPVTLNVNRLGAKDIKRYGSTNISNSATTSWNANSVVLLTYDGAYWQLTDYNNTTYSAMSVAEYEAGTATTARLMTPQRLKAAIQHWATGEANVQSDWGQTDSTADDFIKNKPTIPSKTSDLTNDSGFITSFTETDPVFTASPAYGITAQNITSWNNKVNKSGDTGLGDMMFQTGSGIGLKFQGDNVDKVVRLNGFGGAAGYNLYFRGFDVGVSGNNPVSLLNIADPTSEQGAATKKYVDDNKFSGSYNDLTNKPTIPTVPTNVSAFTNDSGYITGYTETDPVFTASPAHSITSQQISDWNNKPSLITLLETSKNAYALSVNGSTATLIEYGSGETANFLTVFLSYTNIQGCFFGQVINGASDIQQAQARLYEIAELDMTTQSLRLVSVDNGVVYTADLQDTGSGLTGTFSSQTIGTLTTETDPTVPAWAKASSKPSYGADEISFDNTQQVTYITAQDVNGALTDLDYALDNVEHDISGIRGDYFSKYGGTITGDVTLKSDAATNSKSIIFQRGTLTDNYNDWQIQDRGGFLYFDQRGTNSSSFSNQVCFNTSGNVQASTFNGYSLAGASAKSVDTSITSGTTSTNLPTSQAVASYVEGMFGAGFGADEIHFGGGQYYIQDLNDDTDLEQVVGTIDTYIGQNIEPNILPSVSASDNGKVLRVVNGAWSAVALPSASGVSF